MIFIETVVYFRLVDMCEQFAGEASEMEVYGGYKKKPTSRKHFTQYLCHGSGLLGECKKVEELRKKKEEL